MSRLSNLAASSIIGVLPAHGSARGGVQAGKSFAANRAVEARARVNVRLDFASRADREPFVQPGCSVVLLVEVPEPVAPR